MASGRGALMLAGRGIISSNASREVIPSQSPGGLKIRLSNLATDSEDESKARSNGSSPDTDNEIPASWNPMEEAFKDPEFNSYDRGPGRDLPADKQVPKPRNYRSQNQGVTLYVAGIPQELTEDGLTKLFSRAGTVLSARKIPPKNDEQLCIGFINMATTNAATEAIRQLHEFRIGSQYRLRVKFSLSEEEKRRRDQKAREDHEFQKRRVGFVKVEDERGSGDAKPKEVKTPSQSPKSIGAPVSHGGGDVSVQKQGDLGYCSDGIDQANQKDSKHSDRCSSLPPLQTVHYPCVVCRKEGKCRCQRCKTPYCGRECQTKHWPSHRAKCKPSNIYKPTPEDEFESNFDVSVGDEDIQNIIQNVAGGDGPSDAAHIHPLPRIFVEDFHKIMLPYRIPVEVLLTNFESPYSFEVVMKKFIPELNSLTEQMNLYYANTVNAGEDKYVPSVKMLCIAPYDGGWHRAKLLRLNLDATVMVRFIDYGNVETMVASDLRPVREMFTHLPAQAIHCGLHDVCGTEPDGIYSAESIQLASEKFVLYNEYLVTNFRQNAHVSKVEFIEKETNTNVALWLFGRQLAVMKEDVKNSAGSLVNGEASADQQDDSTCNTPQPATTQAAPSVERSTPSPRTPASQQSSSSKGDLFIQDFCRYKPDPNELPTIAKTFQEKMVISIVVNYVVSPHEFYGQVLDPKKVDDLEKMQIALNDHYGKKSPNKGYRFTKFNLVAAPFSDDNWYRGKVLDVTPKGAQILYLDYGNIAMVDNPSLLQSLESDFSQLPFMAVKFQLASIEQDGCWSGDATNYFIELVAGKEVRARVKKSDNWSAVVDLRVNKSSVRDRMVEKGYGRKTGSPALKGPSPAPSQATTSICQKTSTPPAPATSTYPTRDQLHWTKLPLQADPIKVMVSAASAPDDFYVQIVNSNTSEYESALVQKLTALYEKYEGLYTPHYGEILAAQFSVDKQWYRGVVIEVKSTSAVVQFIDYGNVDDVPLTSMTCIDPSLLEYPVLGVHCSLGLQLVEPSNWSPKLLRESVVSNLQVKETGELNVVSIMDPITEELVGDTLVKMGIAKAPVRRVMKEALTPAVIPTRKDPIPSMVTDAPSPTGFWVQVLDPRTVELSEKLKSSCSGGYQPQAVGELVCAQFSVDQCWYRAVVTALTGKKVSVQFVDYGNSEELTAESVSTFDESLLMYPVQCVLCSLQHVKLAPGQAWDPNFLRLFQMSHMVVKEKKDDILIIDLLTEDSVPMAEYLIQNGVLCLDKPSTQQKAADMGISKVPIRRLTKEALTPASISTSKDPIPSMVTDAPSPTGFWVQVLDPRTVELSEKLKSSCSGGYQPQAVGELVCAQFSVDQCWYRAVVTALTGKKISVQFVDYGNSEELTAESVSTFDESLLMYPVQCVLCSLQHVKLAPGQAWDPNFLRLFQMGHMVVKEKKDESLIIDLLTEDSVSLTESLIQNRVLCLDKPSTQHKPAEICSPAQCKSPPPVVKSPPAIVSPRTVISPQRVRSPAPGSSTNASPGKKSLMANSLTVTQLSIGETVMCRVTESASPEDVWIQVIEDRFIEAIADLATGLAQHYSTYNGSYSPKVVGELVAARFQEDQCWYRAEVLDISSCQYNVRFIDYGNCQMTTGQSIAELAECFVKYPVQATNCSLNQVQLGPGIKWDPASQIELFRPLTLKVKQRQVRGPYQIDLIDEQNASLIDKLLRTGTLVRCVPESPVLPPVPSSVPSSVPSPSTESHHTSPPPTLPVQKIDGDKPLVKVWHVVNPSCFYVQWLNEEIVKKMNDLTTAINMQAHEVLNSPPSVGQIVAAKVIAHNGIIYRAEVLSVATETAYIQFVDFGDDMHLPITDLYKLENRYAALPRQAVKCSLNISAPKGKWTDSAVSLVKTTICEKQVILNVIKQDSEGCLVADVTYSYEEEVSIASSQKSLLDLLMMPSFVSSPQRASIASSPALSPSSQHTITAKPKRYMTSQIPVDQLELHTILHAAVAHVESVDRFWLQIANEHHTHRLQALLEKLAEICQTAKASHQPVVGEVVAGFFEGCWYRAEVCQTWPTKAELFYLDFGNTAVTNISDIREVSDPSLMQTAVGAFQCCLSGGPWKEDANDFMKSTLNTLVEVRVNKIKDGVCHVDLGNEGCPNFAEALRIPSRSVPASPPAASAPLNAASAQVPSSPVYTLKDLPEKHVDGDCVAMIGQIFDVDHFYCHVPENSADAQNLAIILNTECNKMAPLEGFCPGTNEVVTCQFSADGEWYRGLVKEKMPDGSMKIFFLDFGNSEVRTSEFLRPFKDAFVKPAPQAVKCALAGVVARSAKAVESFHRVANEQQLKLKVCKIVGDTHHVEVVNESGVDVADYLLQEGVVEKTPSEVAAVPATAAGAAAATPPEPSPTQLASENAMLKHQLEEMQKQIAMLMARK